MLDQLTFRRGRYLIDWIFTTKRRLGVVAIIIGLGSIGIHYWLNHLIGYQPFFTIVGTILGLAMAALGLYSLLRGIFGDNHLTVSEPEE